MANLDKDFEDFRNSPAAKEPAFFVREDWREWQLEQAILNGDMASDLNPNTEVSDGWAEPEEFLELTPEEIEALESSEPQKLTKASRDSGLDRSTGSKPEEE